MSLGKDKTVAVCLFRLCGINIHLFKIEISQIKVKKALVEETTTLVEERTIDYKAKKEELDSIEAETAQQVAELMAKAEKAKEPIDERLLTAYNRIRSNVHNGLAVVTVTRDACGGCFNRIPPQRQVDIRQGKKLIVCEYCGRILVSE